MTEAGALAAFKPIQNSSKAPCAMQKEVAEHNSAYDTLKKRTPAVYKAPCETDKKPVASPEPKTS